MILKITSKIVLGIRVCKKKFGEAFIVVILKTSFYEERKRKSTPLYVKYN